MTAMTKVGGLLTGTLLTAGTCLALSGPAEAVVIPCHTMPCSVDEYSGPEAVPPAQPTVEDGGAVDVGPVALGVLGGAALTGIGVATVALVRRRPTGEHPA